MYSNGIFVFGDKTFYKETKRDAISALPLEMSWKIFSYLDDTSLETAARTHKTWARIILTNKKLRNRLNKFELAIKLGSESLAKFYRKNKRKLRKEKGIHILPPSKPMVCAYDKSIIKTIGGREEFAVYKKEIHTFLKHN